MMIEQAHVMVVTAHPDDAEFGAAGTVSTLPAAGSPSFHGTVSAGAGLTPKCEKPSSRPVEWHLC